MAEQSDITLKDLTTAPPDSLNFADELHVLLHDHYPKVEYSRTGFVKNTDTIHNLVNGS